MKKSLDNDNKIKEKKELINENKNKNEEDQDDNLKYYIILYKLPKYLEKVI
jgi:hypothetical protein